jgi:membrane protein implicated in regulation of membrane protease activity
MTGVYLFAAAAGVPLVLWFVFGGGDDGAGPDDGVAGVMFRWLPLSTLAFAAAAFGVCGLAVGASDAGYATTLAAAVVAGVVAGVVNSTVFGYLRRSESTTAVDDADLAGTIGRVVVPVSGDRRGRIAITVGDQQIHLSAQALPPARSEGRSGPEAGAELDVGASVLVVEVRNGIASVTSLDPELT